MTRRPYIRRSERRLLIIQAAQRLAARQEHWTLNDVARECIPPCTQRAVRLVMSRAELDEALQNTR